MNAKLYMSSLLLFLSISCYGMKPSEKLQKPTLRGIPLVGHDGAVICALFSPSSKKIASGSTGHQNNLMVWNAEDGTLSHNLSGHPKAVTTLQFSLDEKYLISGSAHARKNLILWNADTGQYIRELLYHAQGINDIQCNSEGLIASASNDYTKNLAVWDRKGRLRCRLSAHEGGVNLIRFTPDGKKLLSSNAAWSEDLPQALYIWQMSDGTLLKKVTYYNVIRDLAFNNNTTQYLATRNFPSIDPSELPFGNCILTIWSILNDTKKPQKSFFGHNYTILHAQFSPSGKKIVSCALNDKNNLIIWDNDTGNLLHNLIGHSRVCTCSFSPDEKYVLSAGEKDGGNLYVWDVKTGTIVYNLVGHKEVVYTAQFSPNGKYIISAGGDYDDDTQDPALLDGDLILWFFGTAH